MRAEVDEILNKDKQNNDIILLDDYIEKQDDNNNLMDKCLSNEKASEIEKNEYISNEELSDNGSSSS